MSTTHLARVGWKPMQPSKPPDYAMEKATDNANEW
jgi:hypothetical protein